MLRDDGRWDFPGGHSERHDDSVLDTALRELSEETGYQSRLSIARPRLRVSWCPEFVLGHMWKDCRTQYTGFVGYVPREFTPRMDPEHFDADWRNIDAPPDPLLPGVDFMLAWAQELALV
jgi:8-oxo-dGTP pyrophosphatase MutT (NUDIX family)